MTSLLFSLFSCFFGHLRKQNGNGIFMTSHRTQMADRRNHEGAAAYGVATLQDASKGYNAGEVSTWKPRPV